MKENARYGKLVTVKCVEKRKKNKHAKWLCRCDCGKEKIVLEGCLYGGGTRSCGCLEYKNKCICSEPNYYELMKQKIQKKIQVDANGCWSWKDSRHRQGYGILSFRKKYWLAHRVSWTLYKGEIPEGMCVCHNCPNGDQTSCVNPDHLFIGTQKDNVKDAIFKGKFLDRPMGKRRNKLTFDQVQEIKSLDAQGVSRKEIENKFSVKATCIAKILTGRSWKKNWTKEL